MYCSNCGNKLEEHQDVCLNCGKVKNKEKVNVSNPAAKSKVVAGILGIFVGYFGVHNFYLGYSGKGLAQLLLTVLSCGFLSPVTGLWGLIEGIMILTGSIDRDAEGVLLKD